MSALTKEELKLVIDEHIGTLDEQHLWSVGNNLVKPVNNQPANDDQTANSNVYFKWLGAWTQSSYEAWSKHPYGNYL